MPVRTPFHRAAALIALSALGPPRLALAADHLTSFTSVSVDLPFGDTTFPDGPGLDVINNNCLACHSAGMVLTQPPLPRAVWQTEVEKMRAAYKAPVAQQDVQPIVDYLTRLKGPS